MKNNCKYSIFKEKHSVVLFVIIFVFVCIDSFTYEIKGKVYQPEGSSSSNVTIWCVHPIKGASKVVTDEAGQFAFTDIPMGEVSLIARDSNKKIGGVSLILTKNETNVNINLYNGVVQKLRILNPNLVPVSGAYIRRLWVGDIFCIPAEEISELGFGWIRSDDNGEILLDNMPVKGFIRVLVGHIDYADTYLPFIPVNNKSMDIILKKGVIIRGRVVKDGKGVKEALIISIQKGVGNEPFILPVKTDKEGLYRYRLGKGEYRIFASYPDYPNTIPKEISITGDEQEELLVDFEFKDPLYIEGTVSLKDGTPCQLAKVAIKEENGVEDFVFTDDVGKYLLKSSSQKVKVKIIPPPGFITETLPEVPVDFQNEKKVFIPNIYVKKLPEIKGKITLPNGEGADKVFIQSKNTDFPIFAITNNEGNFHITFDSVPEVNTVEFVVEHALRFLRAEFSFNLYEENPLINLPLQPFEPKQEKFINKEVRNKLGHIIDNLAPEIECRAWFNYKDNENPLQKLQGKVVLLLFWGGFDTTPFGMRHVEEARALFDLYKGVSDVAILSVHDGLSEEEEVENYIKTYRIEFPVGLDTDDTKTFVNYSIEFIPQFVLIDKKGIVRYTDVLNRTVELIKVLRRMAGN
ncbi:MAG TPA: redoxin domain-containing protein [Candidatus Hydrogenedens sp.]|nr:redoxin domain-containing protein [Candidatus Hydrogenedens sp.]